MATNEERREVAARLRGDPYDTLIPYRTGIHFGMGCHEAANRFWDMCGRIKSAGDYDIAYSTRYVLADLIEPEPERTCEILHDDNLSEQYGGPMARCSYCGAVLPEEFIGPYYYCPCCGSKNKVVCDANL